MNTDRIARARAACEAARTDPAVFGSTPICTYIDSLDAALDALESARGALREIQRDLKQAVEAYERKRDRTESERVVASSHLFNVAFACIARAELDKEQG